MIPVGEFVKRSLKGPLIEEKEFDLRLSRTVPGLVAEFGIQFKPEELICGDSTADAIFQAAIELLGRVGIFNVDTSRVILLERDELLAMAEAMPAECTVGGGADAVRLVARTHDGKTPPVVVSCPVRSTQYREGPQRMFFEMITAFASENSRLGELARLSLAQLEGIDELADTPGEVMWCRAVARWQRALATVMGKPDMWLMHNVGVSVSAILACHEEGLLDRYSWDMPIYMMPELKVNWDILKLSYIAQEMRIGRWIASNAMIGLMCGTAEGAAVIAVADALGQLGYGHGDKGHIGMRDRRGNRSTRIVNQARNAALRAAERNIGNPLGAIAGPTSGLGTARAIYEETANLIGQTCSGAAWIWGFPCHPGSDGELKVDLDCMLVQEISSGVAGLGREEAGELQSRVLSLYETAQGAEDTGKGFAHYYDLKTLTPTKGLVELYKREADTLVGLGVPIEAQFVK